MAGVVKSVIMTNPVGRWYIQLSDMMKENHKEICLDIHEYAEKIEKIGEEYGGKVDVMWSSEDDVTLIQINEVRQQIMAYEAEEAVRKEKQTYQEDGTPNFNG